jgi:hypothetical protein
MILQNRTIVWDIEAAPNAQKMQNTPTSAILRRWGQNIPAAWHKATVLPAKRIKDILVNVLEESMLFCERHGTIKQLC